MKKKLEKNLKIRDLIIEEYYNWDMEMESDPEPYHKIPFHKKLHYLSEADKFIQILKKVKLRLKEIKGSFDE